MILILGASGRIGGYLFDRFKQAGADVVGTYCNNGKDGLLHFDLETMTLSDLDLKPDHVIFGAAANPRPELSKNADDSYKANVPRTIELIDACFDRGIVPIYISTDNVYDGRKGNYDETNATGPLNNYGKMKCEVEAHLLSSTKPYILLRMGKIFGIDDTLLLETYNNLLEGIEQPYATDQIFTPTYAEDLYECMSAVIDEQFTGTLHLGSTEATTRYELAERMKAYFGMDVQLIPAKINELGLSEPRPLKIDLNTNKYRKLTGKKNRELEYFMEKIITGIDPDLWERNSSGQSLAYFAKTKQVTVSRELLDALIRCSAEMGNINARFCLHADPEDNLQDMVILARRDSTCRKPHKHKAGMEAIQMIEGKALAVIFDEDQNLIDRRVLEPDGEFAYRNEKGRYHIYLPLTDYMVQREIRDWKNEPGETVPPDWADWQEVMSRHLGPEDLECRNASCTKPCRFRDDG